MSAARPLTRGRAAGSAYRGLVAALLGASLLVAGCTSGTGAVVGGDGTTSTTTAGGSSTGAAPSTSTVPAVAIAVVPALGSTDVAPSEPLTVTAAHGTLSEVRLTRTDGTAVAGRLSADRTTWTADGLLGYDRSYQVSARAVGGDGAEKTVSGSVSTVQPTTLTYASAIPNPDLTLVGVGQPIALYFDEDITDRAAVERRLTVTSDPPVQGVWHWFSDREVHFRPQSYWPAGAHVRVDVDIYGIDVGNNIFGQESRHLEFDVREHAMTAEVDAGDLQLRIYRDGQLVRAMPTSLGKPGFETYSGIYVVADQHDVYTMDSSTYGLAIDDPNGYRTEVEFASRLSNTGIFVHAAPWSVGDQGVRSVSHGCLNVSTEDAQWFYENFGRGDLVTVTGTGVPLQPTDGFGDWNVSWPDWVAGSALA